MTKISKVLRRTDCAAALVIALVLAVAAGAATHDKIGAADRPAGDRQQTAELRGTLTNNEHLQIDVQSVPHPLLRSDVIRADLIVARPSPTELEIARLSGEERCLAEAMYYEARGEGTEGQMAIAEVVFHRLHHRGFPSSICGVVYQGVSDEGGCQFSFVCDGEMLHRKTSADWRRAKLLAEKILSGYTHLGNSTDGATSFHTIDVEPDWSSNLERTVQIGNHIFYKPLPRTRAS
ncbi:MAG TPA: cell wall hydrolase [Rhizomicrobium sp.]|nr:cell wall hydrolase [Rhizomicrobium sp.]